MKLFSCRSSIICHPGASTKLAQDQAPVLWQLGRSESHVLICSLLVFVSGINDLVTLIPDFSPGLQLLWVHSTQGGSSING